MPSNYALAAFLYLLSGETKRNWNSKSWIEYNLVITFSTQFSVLEGLLDALDGYAARRLGQGSRFGGMLDLITDM